MKEYLSKIQDVSPDTTTIFPKESEDCLFFSLPTTDICYIYQQLYM